MSDVVPADFPKAAMPWAQAAADYATAVLESVLLQGDWGKAQDAYDVMVAEQGRFFAGFIGASSGAATELDYYAPNNGLEATESDVPTPPVQRTAEDGER